MKALLLSLLTVGILTAFTGCSSDEPVSQTTTTTTEETTVSHPAPPPQ